MTNFLKLISKDIFKVNKSKNIITCNNKSGFSFAEVIITLTVIGIIATITIPALISRQKELYNKERVKNAVSTFETAMSKIIIENNIKTTTELINWANQEDNCQNTTKYFKKTVDNGCIFKTANNVWWNIENPERPIIYINKEGITKENILEVTKKANTKDNKEAFVLIGHFDNVGSFRMDDLTYETNNNKQNSKMLMEKLYGYMGNITPIEEMTFKKCKDMNTDTCKITIDGIEYIYKKVHITEESIGKYCFYDREKGKTACNKYSTSTDGYIYVSDVIDKPTTEDGMNCEGSTYTECETNGDYYEAAKRNCEKQGARLATIAELKSMQENNLLPGTDSRSFWAFNENSSKNAFYVDSNGVVNTSYKYLNRRQSLCVGQEQD